ncbi:hypothetical protein TMatcc_003984 [Talaromyces marneffei ATCC 18224]|uniref:uncharacterized protein n=1 Tax=Talaromyces marneffei TaxID=37727 RepID=UPI0012A93D35|nr:uncharacterized protein EYB26_001031 [Talaromyces marneffei]KAE8556603.1 hypothetical protein EYB25_001305 [Talaromyces marneffei]QGA13382.1 hypothetical protein EYB26_001031 [Talaromyces marneffei]
MAPPPLRVGVTVDGSRMTITFSQRACAQRYNDYLTRLEDSIYEIQECGFSASRNAVFMILPPEITTTPPSPDNPKNSTLILEDKAKAITWGQKMILWKTDIEADGTQLSLVTVWKVDDFYERLRLPKQDSDDEEGTEFPVDVSQRQGSIGRPDCSDPYDYPSVRRLFFRV